MQLSTDSESKSEQTHVKLQNIIFYCLSVFILTRVLNFVEYYVITHFVHFEGFQFSSSFFINICRWDCYWYLDIINHGYQLLPNPMDGSLNEGRANWAFWPLFPFLINALSWLGSPLVVAYVLNQSLLFVSTILLFNYISKSYSIRCAQAGVLFLCVGSENIYFMSMYTESLFLFLSLLSICLIQRHKSWWAAISCAFLGATRINGFFMSIVLIFNEFNQKPINLSRVLKISIMFIISLSGLLTFMLFLKFHVGDSLAFYHIQTKWSRLNFQNISSPITALKALLNSGFYLDRIMCSLSLVVTLWLVSVRRWNDLLFFVMCVCVALISLNLKSYTRFFFGWYPVYLFLAVITERSRALQYILIFIFLGLHFTMLFFWLFNSFYAY
ncbi:MAG: hypothetical protein EKK54_09635 [Neisseriaceae bacterium]|nr:MAG: hypothetical protein EKK54_09635 [Neisseriaceae bacterium]